MTPSTLPAPPPSTMAGQTRRARINLAAFALITAGFGWLYVALDHASGAAIGTGSATDSGGTPGQGLWIAVPALAGVVLYYASRDGGGPLGLTLRFPRPVRWLALAAGLSVAIIAAGVLAGVLAGAVTVRLQSAPGTPTFAAAVGAVLGFLVVKNILEEFIFRGYATRTAIAAGLPGVRGHLLVGAIWAAWHLPLYLVWMSVTDYRASTSLPLSIYLPMFCLGTLALAVVLGELRVQTGSIWPGVVLHTVSGALTVALLTDGHLVFKAHTDGLFSPNANSIASILAFFLVGLAFLGRRRRVSSP